MDKAIKDRIEALLLELRSWDVDEQRHTVQELAKMFGLTTFVVHRIANAEDIKVSIGAMPGKDGEMADPDADTQPIEAKVDENATTRAERVIELDDVEDVDEDADTNAFRRVDSD